LFGLPTAALSAFGYARIIERRSLEAQRPVPASNRQRTHPQPHPRAVPFCASSSKKTQKTVNTRRRLRRPRRLAHISDLRVSGLIPISFLKEAFRRTLALKPDLACIAGDFVTTDNDFDKPKYESALQMLSSKVPTYAVMGNHDGGACAARSGWLAMNHNPDGKDNCGLLHWDLMLCGHTHGGQVIVPLYGPPIVPIVETRYAVGLNAYQNRWIHTTRGVGNIVGICVNCRPERSLLLVS
jgi:predicted MPP superfamily phosphohydrolase